MAWYSHIAQLERDRTDFVIVTLLKVRGHAPREVGAKMLVTARQTFETIGGGNVEQQAIVEARALLDETSLTAPRQFRQQLTPKAGDHGVQCCGGEVTVLLEKVLSRDSRLPSRGQETQPRLNANTTTCRGC